MTVLLVLIGGAIGAVLRYLTDVFVQSRHRDELPWGTMTVNIIGSLILGATAGAVAATDGPTWVLTLVGTGFCGALTTFSTFGFQTLELVEGGLAGKAAVNVSVSLAAGMAACVGGWALAAALV